VLDIAWAVFSVINLAAIFGMPNWETIPFHFIWISLTTLYGFRTWRPGPTMWILGAVMITTACGIGLDVYRGSEPMQELTEVPLMAAVFVAMAWHARRKLLAEAEARRVGEENARLLGTQRQFLQDAAHELRTPITIALGHAELLASTKLDAPQQAEDIQVVIGELSRLRRIAERLLVIAAASDPEFLRSEPVALDLLAMELIRRWRPTAVRRWQASKLDRVTVYADRERIALALDALLENAVRHTREGDVIQLSVIRGWPGMPARIVVGDTGDGIPPERLAVIFDRFRTSHEGRSGTGLGLALVRAVARAHGGDVTARSGPSGGSEFEITLPETLPATGLDAAGPDITGPGTVNAGAGNAGDAETSAEGGSPGSAHSESRRAAHRP
jgi:signal transduction histidine kinase